MQLLDVIEIRGGQGGRIELFQGDLTELSPAERVDALVVSAFRDDYAPVQGTLIGALHRKGLSVGELAHDKDIDLRSTYSCWLSRDFTPPKPGLAYRRILCFEPVAYGKAPEVVGDIFRALTPILAVRPEIKSLALPVVSSGNMGFPVGEMLPRSLVRQSTGSKSVCRWSGCQSSRIRTNMPRRLAGSSST